MARTKLDTERTLKIVLEYEGTGYSGWQLQSNAPSIQGEVEKAIEAVLGEAVRVHGAGRTDAGVHALRQVAHLRSDSSIPLIELKRALNAHLAEDIAVRIITEESDEFHARYSARGKTYAYAIRLGMGRSVFDRRVCWPVPYELDLKAMAQGADHLEGHHDFRGLATIEQGRSAERQLRRIELIHRPPYLLLLLEADGFLWKMVRRIVGSLVTVGRGKEEPQWIAEILDGRGAVAGGPTAPPQGLCLVDVDYPTDPAAEEEPWPPWPCFFLAARAGGQ
ncbi:MAG: tRNA pseudouridine(38-40) synthase TruA [Planctomycetota bacterium]|jgi:tRNA pseudouridine38-40 synthase